MTTLSPAQLLERKRGLGGSDMNALAGSHKSRGPIDVWCDKTDPAAPAVGDAGEEPDDHDRAAEALTADQKRGIFFENGAREWVAHDTGAAIHETGTLWHAQHPLVLATPDGHMVYPDGERRALEIKFPRRADDWLAPGLKFPHSLRVPAYYLPQVTWECAVLGVKKCDVAVYIYNELHLLTVDFDPELFAQLLALANRFWERHVLTGKPPPPDASESYVQYLRRQYPQNTDPKLLPAEGDVLREARVYVDMKAQISQMEKVRRAASSYLKTYIGTHDGVDLGDGQALMWRSNSPSQVVDYKALVADLGVDAATLAKYTSERPGARPFTQQKIKVTQ